MIELPRGWAETELGEIAEIKLGKMLDKIKNKGEPTPYLRNVNVRWGHFDLDDILQMQMSADERATLSIRDGDILLCEGGEPGRSAVWQGGSTNLTFQKALMRLRPSDEINPYLLTAFLRWSYGAGALERHFTGTTIKHLPQAALSRVPLPLPPLPEQRRIVARIDSLTGKSTRARDHLNHIPRLVEKYKQALLAAAFRGDAPLVRVGDVITDIRYGTAKKCDYGGAVPVLRIPNVQGGRIDLADLKSANFDAKELAKLALRPGDILVIRSNGSLDLVGRSAVVDDRAASMLFAGYLIRLRNDPTRCLPEYLHRFLQSPIARDRITNAAKSTSGVNNVNAQQLQALELPLPDIATQQVVITRIESAFGWIDRLAADATSARKLIDHLDQSILAKAFRGELVLQDPTDEPATALLARIRTERAAAPKAKRGRRKAA